MIKDKKPSTKKNSRKKSTLTEDINLSNHPETENQTDSQLLLPHERDESTGSTSTEKQGDKRSRELIKKAHEDTRRGMLDTDRRGIPSDIIESDIPAANDIPDVPDNEKKRKR
ncbi:MAG: hypothetical protein NMNS01_24190 [Nitrosomonas sp.]|nr:MAG: hypothetical protein NMNS01_24190 [Nitrosomonas sp.]